MKLKKGPLKVITMMDHETFDENERRRSAGGVKFRATVRVAVEAEEGKKPQIVEGFAVNAKNTSLRSSIIQFPHHWAVPSHTPIRSWIETTDEVEVITNFEESNNT